MTDTQIMSTNECIELLGVTRHTLYSMAEKHGFSKMGRGSWRRSDVESMLASKGGSAPQTVQPQTVQPQTVQPQTVQPQTVQSRKSLKQIEAEFLASNDDYITYGDAAVTLGCSLPSIRNYLAVKKLIPITDPTGRVRCLSRAAVEAFGESRASVKPFKMPPTTPGVQPPPGWIESSELVRLFIERYKDVPPKDVEYFVRMRVRKTLNPYYKYEGTQWFDPVLVAERLTKPYDCGEGKEFEEVVRMFERSGEQYRLQREKEILEENEARRRRLEKQARIEEDELYLIEGEPISIEF